MIMRTKQKIQLFSPVILKAFNLNAYQIQVSVQDIIGKRGEIKYRLQDKLNQTVDIATSGGNGLVSHLSEAVSTTYYIYALMSNSDGSTYFSLHNSAIANTGVKCKLIHSLYNDAAGDFVPADRINDKVFFHTPQVVYSGVTLTLSFVEYALPACVPDDCEEIYLISSNSASNTSIWQELSPNSSGTKSNIAMEVGSIYGNNLLNTFITDTLTLQMDLNSESIWAKSSHPTLAAGTQCLHIIGYKKAY